MKIIRLCFYVFVFCCFNPLFAQNESDKGMLFPQFERGTVIFKTGVRTSASLNYDMRQQQMLFLDADSTIMVIAKPLDIRVVIIGERRFVPVSSNGLFYEEVQAGQGSFFVKQKATLLSEGKAAGYGGYSQTTSVSSYASLHDDMGNTVQLSANEKFRVKIESFYYLKSGNSYKKFFSSKTLGKLFKGNESKIEEFANTHSIDFSKTDDVARIVEYGYSISTINQ